MYEILNKMFFEFIGKINYYKLSAKDDRDIVVEVAQKLETGQKVPKKYRIYIAIVGFRSKLVAHELEIWIDRWNEVLSELPDLQSSEENLREKIWEDAKDFRKFFRLKSRMLRLVNVALHRSDVLEEEGSQALAIVKDFLEREVGRLEKGSE